MTIKSNRSYPLYDLSTVNAKVHLQELGLAWTKGIFFVKKDLLRNSINFVLTVTKNLEKSCFVKASEQLQSKVNESFINELLPFLKTWEYIFGLCLDSFQGLKHKKGLMQNKVILESPLSRFCENIFIVIIFFRTNHVITDCVLFFFHEDQLFFLVFPHFNKTMQILSGS